MINTVTRTVDITPHPKILMVLGEIEFKPWQCIAEFIDNCVDSFLAMQRLGTPISAPTVRVALGKDTVVVKDNGPGMSLDMLELAVKAGWTSNERFGSLGLYGVGFNIATARLGSLTTIWTTQAGDEAWYGLELDLPKIARGGTYQLDPKTRMKSDPNTSGTEIKVSRLKPDWSGVFLNPSWVRTNLTKRLASIYSTMLRDTDPQPTHFSLYLNDKKVFAHEHCVWPADWDVYRKSEGLVRPIQEIDITFGKKYMSRSTGQLYDLPEELEPEDVIEIPERIYGWLGIQRYAHEHDYGIDILRNGRKIEVGSKDVFKWEQADGTEILEYPIDDPRYRGRIVGEIHLDHGYVHYTKHRFEREHSSWKQLLQAVRHNEPLTRRSNQGYSGVNESPLGLLFRVFRRNSPQRPMTYWDILFIKDNDKAITWAEKYRRGEAEYRDDEKWRKEILEGDKVEKKPEGGDEAVGTTQAGAENTDDGQEDDFILGPSSDGSATGQDEPDSAEQPSAADRESEEPEVSRQLLPDLSLHITGIGLSGRAYNVEVYSVDSPDNSDSRPAWRGRLTEKNVYEIEVNLQHPAFNSTSLRVRDAVLAELAHVITSEETAALGPREEISYGTILVALRRQYATTDSIDANQLRIEIEQLRRQLVKCLSKHLSEDEQKELLQQLESSQRERVELAQARGPNGSQAVDYLGIDHIASLCLSHPELFFEANCFDKEWTPNSLSLNPLLLQEHRKQLTAEVAIPLAIIGDFSNKFFSADALPRTSLALIRACVNYLSELIHEDSRSVRYI